MEYGEFIRKVKAIRPDLKIKRIDKDCFGLANGANPENGALTFQGKHKGEIEISLEKYHLASIIPPHDELEIWAVDVSTEITYWIPETLPAYLKLLSLCADYADDKNQEMKAKS